MRSRAGDMPAGSADFDRTNNVEQVVWTSVPVDTCRVIVAAHRVTLEPQKFALVIRIA